MSSRAKGKTQAKKLASKTTTTFTDPFDKTRLDVSDYVGALLQDWKDNTQLHQSLTFFIEAMDKSTHVLEDGDILRLAVRAMKRRGKDLHDAHYMLETYWDDILTREPVDITAATA